MHATCLDSFFIFYRFKHLVSIQHFLKNIFQDLKLQSFKVRIDVYYSIYVAQQIYIQEF